MPVRIFFVYYQPISNRQEINFFESLIRMSYCPFSKIVGLQIWVWNAVNNTENLTADDVLFYWWLKESFRIADQIHLFDNHITVRETTVIIQGRRVMKRKIVADHYTVVNKCFSNSYYLILVLTFNNGLYSGESMLGCSWQCVSNFGFISTHFDLTASI